MAILDDLLSLLPRPVWSPTVGTNVYNLMAAIANELSRFNDLSAFVHEQVNITTSTGEFLDIHGLDFAVDRSINLFTGLPESDIAYRASILASFSNIRLNKYVLQNLLVPYSNNPPIVFEDMIDRWFAGGDPSTDFQPFSFIGFDTIGESENLIDTISNISANTDSISFQVKDIANGRYIQVPFTPSTVNSSQFSISAGGLNLQGAFKPGRHLSFITNSSSPTVSYATVSTFEFENSIDNVVFLDADSVPPSGDSYFVYPQGDTAFVIYQDPASGYVYSWTAQITTGGFVEIDNSKRSDTVPEDLLISGDLPLGNLPDYTQLNTSLLSVRGTQDPMYMIDVVLSTVSPKLGDAGLLGQGLFLGPKSFPPASKVLSVLNYNKIGGVVPRIFIVEDYVGDFRNNSNNLTDLYG